jgi:hypothetical protein
LKHITLLGIITGSATKVQNCTGALGEKKKMTALGEGRGLSHNRMSSEKSSLVEEDGLLSWNVV